MELVAVIYILEYYGNVDMIVVLINDHQTIICTAIGWECGGLGCAVYIGMKSGWILYILHGGWKWNMLMEYIWYIEDGVGVCVGDIVGAYIADNVGILYIVFELNENMKFIINIYSNYIINI